MIVKTSFWARHLPPDHVRIGISRGSPRWMKGTQPRLAELAPGSWLYTTDDPEEYRVRYVTQLAALDPVRVVERIRCEAAGKVPVLTCFCKPGGSNWCHRAWVSVWLAHRAGLTVEEYGFEGQGFAASHIMLPAEFRRSLQTSAAPIQPAQLSLL